MPTPPASHDLVALIASLGLRPDVPHAVVKSIVVAIEARDRSDVEEVKLALSNFNLPALLKPGVDVHSFATGLVDLARSETWPPPVKGS